MTSPPFENEARRVDKVIALPDPRLREVSTNVDTGSACAADLALRMSRASLAWEGQREHEVAVALAAVQIGIPRRVVILRRDYESQNESAFDVIMNPVIVELSRKIDYDHEGCLSVLDLNGRVPRHRKVTVRGAAIDGSELHIEFKGFLARVIQHEIDHLDGILFPDRIDNKKDLLHLQPNGDLVQASMQVIRRAGVVI